MNTVVGGYFEHAMWGKITLQGDTEKKHIGENTPFLTASPQIVQLGSTLIFILKFKKLIASI
jgi:hypothetical protein